MENEVSLDYISELIEKIKSSLGVKEPISSKKLFSLIDNGEIKSAVKFIAKQFGLPIDIIITVVPDDYQKQSSKNRFYSTNIAKNHGYDFSNEGIIAQVSIPNNLPFYGSAALNNFPINVKISKQSTKNSDIFAMIIAHEISHILLHSLDHPQKENEFLTDINAIMQGFQYIFNNGRKVIIEIHKKFNWFTSTTTTTTQTRTYGYLNDNQFEFVFRKSLLFLEKSRNQEKKFLKDIGKSEKILSKYQNVFLRFKRFLKLISQNLGRKISSEDAKIIMTFFQSGYIENIDSLFTSYKEKLESANRLLESNTHYTDQRTKQILTYSKDLNVFSSKTKKSVNILKANIKTMKKYISFKDRILIQFLLFHIYK